MLDALRFEWTRIATLRSTYWLIGMGLLVTTGVAVLLGVAARNEPLDAEILTTAVNGGASFGLPFLAVFMAIIGIFACGHEYRHGTIQPTLTSLPQRSRLILAKLIVVTVTTVVVTALSMAINTAVVYIVWGEAPGLFEDPIGTALAGYAIYTLIYVLVGFGLGLLFRGVPSALVVIFLMPLIIESIIMGLAFIPALDWLVPVVKFLPFTAGSRLMEIVPPDFGPGSPDFDLFSRWTSGGIFALFAAVILTTAWILFKKRDA
jgi:ABC-2 type transport system permease protein